MLGGVLCEVHTTITNTAKRQIKLKSVSAVGAARSDSSSIPNPSLSEFNNKFWKEKMILLKTSSSIEAYLICSTFIKMILMIENETEKQPNSFILFGSGSGVCLGFGDRSFAFDSSEFE